MINNKFPKYFIDSNNDPIVPGFKYNVLGEICIASFDEECLNMTAESGSSMFQFHYTEFDETYMDVHPIS
jgi:hypothetical protein